MEQRRFWNKNVKKFFTRSSDDTNRTVNDDIVIITNNRTRTEPSTSDMTSIDDFVAIENVIDYFGSPEVLELMTIPKNVLFFKLLIKEISKNPKSTEIIELAEKCSKNSIVLFLVTKDVKIFYLYWKSKEINQFLELKIYDNCDFFYDLTLFKFIADFLANSLKRGHLGLHSTVSITEYLTKIQLHLLADHQNYNLLLIAAELGDLYIVNFLLDASCTTEYRDTNAQTLAYKNRHFDILLSLLKSNLVYPQQINIEECPDDIKQFTSISLGLNEAMLEKNSEKVLEILNQNPQMRHFYNLNNESAPAFALRNKLWDIYGILISKNLILGPHEKFSRLKKEMKEKEREGLREIHYIESKFLPDNHMHVLISNSRVAPGTTEHEEKYKKIQNAFEILNQNPLIQIILMIVAASRNFRIVFDFNQNSVEHIDPTTADGLARGAFYTFGRIYIAAKQLLDPKTKFEALGTLAHELCHCAMNLVYKNMANPYIFGDSGTEQEFEEISRSCKENCDQEEIIMHVYACYLSQVQHAELIVRVPHLIMQYANNSERFAEIQRIFSKLFKFFEDKIVPELTKALPKIEAKAEVQDRKNRIRIRNLTLFSIVFGPIAVIGIVAAIVVPLMIYTPTYSFNDLSLKDRVSILGATIRYKGEHLAFRDLFPENSKVYRSLTSEHISQIFNGKILDFSDPHLHYLQEQVRHKWKSMAKKLKQNILHSSFTFQNESLKFEDLLEINSEVFSSLSSDQIIEVLDDKELLVHVMIQNETKFYVERKFWNQHVPHVYYEFMKFVQGMPYYFCGTMNFTLINNTFEDFYLDFMNQNISTQLNQINEVKQDWSFKTCPIANFNIKGTPPDFNITDTLLSHMSFQFDFEEVVKIANDTKLFILSSEAGTGKTVTFEQFTMRIKKKFPTCWVSYIDLKDHKHLYKGIRTLQDVRNMLEIIFRLSSKNEFEKKIFEYFFESGNLILLWNGFDEISPNFSEDVTRILGLIRNRTENIQFLCTRPLYSNQLMLSFLVQTYSLISFDDEEKENFITKFFNSEYIEKAKIQNYLEKVEKIVKSTKSTEAFDTPLMLGMIAGMIADDIEIFESENLYEIYQKFVEKKVEIWKNKSEFGQKFLDGSITKYRKFDMMKLYQSYALKGELVLEHYKSARLEVMRQNVPKELTNDEISRMGILYINGPRTFQFAHRTFAEFFVTQYLIENVYNADYNPSDEEAELRIHVLKEAFRMDKKVNTFLPAFFSIQNSQNTKVFNPQIRKVLETKFKNLLFYYINNKYSQDYSLKLLLSFLKKDNQIFKKLLHFDDNATFYTLSFVYGNEDLLKSGNNQSIKSLIKSQLTSEEFKKLILGNNQKGVMLFSVYCLTKKGHDNISHDYYKLDDVLLRNNDPLYVFESIAKKLTKDERRELFEWAQIILAINNYFTKNLSIEIQNLENNYFEFPEQKETFMNTLRNLKFSPVYKDGSSALVLGADLFLKFFSSRFDEFCSNDEIYRSYNDFNIFGNSLKNYEYFKIFWDFFVKRTTREQQKTILRQTKTCELESCIPCGILTQSVLTDSYKHIQKIYDAYFSTAEIQEIVLAHSTDLFLYILSNDFNKNLTRFLKSTFNDNKKDLRRFLERTVEPFDQNILELSDFLLSFYMYDIDISNELQNYIYNIT